MERKNGKTGDKTKLIKKLIAKDGITDEHKKMLEYLHGEYSLYEKIASLCEKEHELIDSKNMIKLREFLIEKHNALESILKIEKEKCQIEEKIKDVKNPFTLEEKKWIEEFINDFRTLIDKVSDMQKKNHEFLESKHREEVEEFVRLKKGMSMNRAYSLFGDSIPDTRHVSRLR